MDTLLEVLSPSFLLFPAVLGSVVLGLVCPVVGGFLVLRRSVLLGLALPQLAAAGVAAALLAHHLGLVPDPGHPGHTGHFAHESQRLLAYGGSLAFTFAGMLLLGYMDRNGAGRTETRLAVAYALGGSLTVLLVAAHPFGDATILGFVKGEVLALSLAELAALAVTCALVLSCLLVFRRELLLSSFDRDLTLLLKGGVVAWDVLLYLAAGVTIASGVIVAGPLLVFGLLVLPPVAVRPLVSRMATYFVGSAALGVFIGLAGFVVSYRLDLPLAPTDVALGCALIPATYALARLGRKVRSAGLPRALSATGNGNEPFDKPPPRP